MNKRPTKRQLRDQLNQAVDSYIHEGGEVQKFVRGDSALTHGQHNDRSLGFEQPKQTRTPLNDELKSIDERKNIPPAPKKTSGPRSKTLYDDFGEAVRIIWVDE